MDVPGSHPSDLLDVHIVTGVDEVSPRVIYIREFGGFGNDAVAFAAPDVSSPRRRAAAGQALRAALVSLALPRPMALQVGCVPEECEEEVRSVVEEAFASGLSFIARVAQAQGFMPPMPSPTLVPPEIEPQLQLQRVDCAGHELQPWLTEALGARGYPESYVGHLVASGEVVPPLVAVDGAGQPVAMVLQEATDLSIGALHVDEACRGKGVGTWLLGCMSEAIFKKHSLPAVSLVEPGNEASQRLHARAGWTMDEASLIWLAFT